MIRELAVPAVISCSRRAAAVPMLAMIRLPATSAHRPFSAQVGLVAACLVIATFATYWNSLRVPFFFDDPAAILANPTIRDWRDLGAVLSPPRNGSGVTGRPLVNLSLALNYALGGTSVAGYHLANILFHAAAGLALFGCVRRTLLLPRWDGRFAVSSLPLAAIAAVLWLLHPLQTESVTCVIQRTEVLVGLFYLLTLYCFIRSVDSPVWHWRGLAVASCFLGMASKEVMVTAPLLVLLYDRTFLAGSFSEAWRLRRSLHLGLAAAWLLLGVLVASLGGTRGAAAGFGVGVTWWSYALKQCEAIVLYLKLTLWPNPLVVFYGVDVVTNPLAVWPQILLLAALVGATFYALWRKPVLGFTGLWFFLILAPSSSVVPLVSQTVSEHRMYLPLAAPLAVGLVALFAAAGRAGLAAAACAILALGVTSARRNVDYRSELSIWTDTVAKVPGNARARVNLGAVQKGMGNDAAALAEYQAALQRDPNSPEAWNNLGTVLLDAGRPAEAITPCETALRLRPNFPLAHNNLGTALVQTGRVADGVAHLQSALSLQPDLAEAHCNLTSAYTFLGKPDEAIVHGEQAVRLRPGMALAHYNLSNAYLKKQQTARAIAELEAAVRLNPRYAEAQLNLGGLYYQSGDPARAIPHFQAALQARPGYLDAHNNLASAFFQTGRAQEAVEQYEAAIRLQPDFAEAHFNLALVLERLGRAAPAKAEYEAALRLKPEDARAREGLKRLNGNAPTPATPGR